MDFYKEFERQTGDHLTHRQKQELERIKGKSQEHMLPYKNTFNKGTGEYSASIDDKIKVINIARIFFLFSIFFPDEDNFKINIITK